MNSRASRFVLTLSLIPWFIENSGSGQDEYPDEVEEESDSGSFTNKNDRSLIENEEARANRGGGE